MAAAITPQKLQPQDNHKAIEHQEKRFEDVLSFPILLSDKIHESVKEAKFFKFECSEVGRQVERLCQMLHSAASVATSNATGTTFYDRPLRRITDDVSKNLEKSRTLVNKCQRRNILCCVMKIVSAADFLKLLNLLDSSVADMRWVLSIVEGGIVLTLPPLPLTILYFLGFGHLLPRCLWDSYKIKSKLPMN